MERYAKSAPPPRISLRATKASILRTKGENNRAFHQVQDEDDIAFKVRDMADLQCPHSLCLGLSLLLFCDGCKNKKLSLFIIVFLRKHSVGKGKYD